MLLTAAILCIFIQPGPEPISPPAPVAPNQAPEPRNDINPEVVLTTKDGSVFQGLLLSRDDSKYVIEIAGIPATFAASKVTRILELRPVLERYKEMRDAVGPGDIEQRISLIRWLADRRQIELAYAEADLLLAKNPRHVAVTKLVEDLRVRTELLTKPPLTDQPGSPSEPATPADSAAIPPSEFPFLSDEQIGLIKVYEIDLAARPRVIFPREAAARMLEQYASSPLIPASREGKEAILRQDPLETVLLMFRLRARDFYPLVRVLDQPEPMRRFRDDVHRVTLINGCATTQCHGGKEAGRFVLSNSRTGSDSTLYTNYYIITNFKASNQQALVDWDRPEQSALLQLALPRELSRMRHPPVVKDGKDIWRAPLSGLDDPRAVAMQNWIKSAYRPRPDYSFDYQPYRPFTPAVLVPNTLPVEPVVR